MPGIIEGIITSAPLFSRLVVVGVCMGADRFRMLAVGKVDASPLVTGTVGLPGVAAAFDAVGDPEAHAKF